MGLFERRLRPGSNLSGIPTDRLLRERTKTAEAVAYVSYINEKSEFHSTENPQVVDADMFFDSMQGLVLHSEIGQELQRRGITPPD